MSIDDLYPWKIEVRNAALERVGEVDDYQNLDMQLKFNDISKWSLAIDRRNRLAQQLLTPGAGIVVTRDGSTVLSGTWQDQDHESSVDRDTVTITGSDDTILLEQRAAHPQPSSTAPPYSTTAEHVVTGVASSVMCVYILYDIGPAAPVVPRRRLAGYTDAGFGASVTGRGRWQHMLELFQELAGAGAVDGVQPGFRVAHLPDGLWFETYQPQDRTNQVVFSRGMGNMKSFSYKRSAPKANYLYVGGQGEGTARTIYEQGDSASIAEWGRIEQFVDARQAANATELSEAAKKALTDGQERNSFAVIPIDLPTMAYGVHYGLGDRVSAVLDVVGPGGEDQQGDVITDILRECRIRLAPDSTEVTPVVGTDGMAAGLVRMFNRVKNLTARVVDLERR